jgi:hypothetical protein
MITLLTRWSLVLWCLLALPASVHAQWWKEPPAPNRLDQRVTDPSGDTAGRLKWDDGYIEVKAGATNDPAVTLNAAHGRGLALDAARQLAYFKLAEIVEGVNVDGVTVVKNAMVEDQTVRTTVQARIKGARVLNETVTPQPDGSFWAEVVMGLLIRGPGGIAAPVSSWAAARPVDTFAPDRSFRVNDQYTGLVIDASDTTFSPALAPRVVEEGTGKVVFGPQLVQMASLSQQGAVGYAPRMADARDSGRAGPNPLIVHAIADGTRKGDLVLTRRDAERVLAADQTGAFLAKGAVVVVIGKDFHEVATGSGKRHALVVGINDYRQGVDGALNKLDFAARDAEALARTLSTRGGFSQDAVTLLRDAEATRDKVIEALKALRSRVGEDDVVLFYFSGHGSMGTGSDGKGHYYLIPQDGTLADLNKSALMDDLMEELIGQLPSRQVVIVLDACFSGGGGGAIRARGVRNANLTVPPAPRPLIEPTSGRIFMAASKPEQVAWEDDQRKGGLFTSYVIEGLSGAADRDGRGVVTALDLYQFVSPRVRDYARQEIKADQTPILEVRGLSGEIELARRR